MSRGKGDYDVFLSYNSRDREAVAKVADFLRKKGLKVFFDVSSIQAGDSWLKAIEDAIRSCQAVIVFQGQEGLGLWQNDEIELALIYEKKPPGLRVIPVLLPGADAALGFLESKHRIQAKSSWDSASLNALATALGIAGARVGRSTKEKEIPAICPYRGLLPFRQGDAPFYFGREAFVQSLRESVEKNSLTALVGPSGSGKSSVVHAGLLPDLRRLKTGFWQAVSMRPGPHPIHSLASVLIRLLEPGKSLEYQKSAAERLAESLLRKEESLDSLSARVGGTGMLLLVVDQWEELCTLAQDNEIERDRFIEVILSASRSNLISVLILFRADFYGRVMEHPELQRRLQGDCLLQLPSMSQADLQRAVEEPAHKVGLSFEAGLVNEILADLKQQPGQIPLLEFVLKRLWIERDQKNQRLLRSSYTGMGRLKGALARKADEIARALPEAEVRRLFLRLVRVEEDVPFTRRRISREELDQPAERIAERFIESRLLVTGWDSKTGEEILEIGHEALIQHWRRLRAWLEEDRAFLIWRDQLEHDVAEWRENDEGKSFLLTAGPLQVAEFWFGQHANDLSPEAHAYIRLSVEKREQEKRHRRILLSAAAALVLTILGLVGFVLYLKEGQASARSAALAAEATRLADRKFDLALLLALQAGKVKTTAEALGATLSLTAGNPALRHFLRRPELPFQKENPERRREAKPEEIQAVAFGSKGLIATGGKGKIFLWDAKQGALHGRPLETREPSQIVSLAFSPDGSLLASGSDTGGLIRLWKLHENEELGPIPAEYPGQKESAQGKSIQNLTFDPRGELLAWSTPSGIHLWHIARRMSVKYFPKPVQETGNWVSGLSFGPAGELVAAMANGRLWRAGRGPQLQPLVETGGLVMGVAFSPEGSLLTAGSSFQRWNLSSGKPIGASCNFLSGLEDEVISVAFSKNKRFVASSHIDRKIRLWDVSSKQGCSLFTALSGHSGLIWSMAFGGERAGKRIELISGGQESDLILWEADPQTPAFSIPLGRRSPGGLATVAVSPDGSLVAVGDSVGQVTLYDGKTRKKLDSEKSRIQRSIFQMAFSGDGRVLATGGPEGHVLLWEVGQRDLRVGSLLRAQDWEDPIRSLAFSQDGAWVAAGTRYGRLLVWQPGISNAPAWPPQKLQTEPIVAIAFATETGLFSQMPPFLQRRQKEFLVTGGFDGKLTLWDLEGRKQIDTVAAHSQSITSLAVRGDGLFASGGLDRNIRLWRLDGGFKADNTLFLGWRIMDLDLSPRGDFLAAAGEEGTENVIVLWDLKARLPLGSEFRAPGMIRHVAFAPSGDSLFLGGKGVSSWWDLRPETWAARACDMVRRGFYPIERETYLRASEKPEVCAG